jgi:branched-chain amino acid transport system substrate-binding protein
MFRSTIAFFFFAFLLCLPNVAICEKHKIGVILPLTGKAAIAGETVRNSIVLANDDLGQPFEIIFEDNGLENTRTVTAVRSLIQTSQVKSLIVYGSGPSNAAAPIAEQMRIPMVGLSVDPSVSRSRKWVMIHWAHNERTADLLISELKRRSISRIAVITSQVPGILDLDEVFLQRAEAAGLLVVFKKQILPTETEFGAIISNLRASKPQAVFINLYFGQSGLFALKCALQGFRPQFFGQFVFDEQTEVSTAQGALNDAFFANSSPGDLSFDNAYLKRFGKRPTLGGIGAYDVTSILALSFKQAPSIPESVNSYLHTLRDFSGKIGRYSALSDNSFDVPAAIGRIVDGQVVKAPHKDGGLKTRGKTYP